MSSKFNPKKHHRRSIRLKGYDYSQAGAYYVTMVAWHREFLFGEVVKKEMILNRYGEIVKHAWIDLPRHYRHVSLGEFIVMPNHVHGIIILNEDRRGGSIVGNNSVTNVTIASKIAQFGDPPLQNHQTSRLARDCSRLQIVFCKTNQRLASNTRNPGLATQLL